MKIAITGSTGFVGQQLVEIFEKQDVHLVLFGRDIERLKSIYPGKECSEYDEMPERLRDVDIVVHLAVLNNNYSKNKIEFEQVNVDLSTDIIEKSIAAGVKKFVNLCSFHEFDQNINNNYSISKRKFSENLKKYDSIDILMIYVPYIFGSKLSGVLRRLNGFPRFIKNILFYFFQSIKPTVNIIKIAELITSNEKINKYKVDYLYENIEKNLIYKFSKVFIDLLFSFSVLIFFFWLLAIIWIAVQLESGSPGIFSQDRVGRSGKTFRCHKFRTMKQSTVQLGTHEVPASAVTKIGKVMRSTKLDELPQIWNILRGELSLVGPRPCLPVQTELLEERTRHGVLSVKPGITGLAQINDVDMSDPLLLVDWDKRYVASRCLSLDIKIIFATLFGSGNGDRVKTG